MVCLSAFFLTLLAVTAAQGRSAAPAAIVSTSAPSSEISEGYTLKVWSGCAAVFSGGSTSPLFITDIRVDSLRERDRDLLEQGITVQSKTELLKLIEDFNS